MPSAVALGAVARTPSASAAAAAKHLEHIYHKLGGETRTAAVR